ncbi:MOSC domain-containing protein [Nocardioides cynanchi]|uniref:MOSC domain-containing protein n=1 Tax=Nocardioides cynanchi TaxID=2558918 RepID=UPI001EE1A834|nr:MOSC domain-containing protein [Nocardioides cynanchi]
MTGASRSPDIRVSRVQSVNVGRAEPNPWKAGLLTGIGKRPTSGPVEVRAPGPKGSGLGSGLVGDYVGDTLHHGGDTQAVYAFAREDLDRWAERLGRELPDGFFGENLTTVGIDVADARIGEVWRIGDEVELRVTAPRIPCSTFRGWTGEQGWLRTFTLDARPGTYLEIVAPGPIASGDALLVVRRPEHDVSVSLAFRAMTVERGLAPRLAAAREDMTDELRDWLGLD